MLGGEVLEDADDRVLFEALTAGLAALCAAALALGAFDGAPPERARGRAAAAAVHAAGPAVAGGHGPAAAPISRLCFRGPRGEPVDFPAAVAEHCPQPAGEGADHRLAGAR